MKTKKIIKNSLVFVIIIGLWAAFSGRINPLFLPDIKDVLSDFKDLIANGMLLESIGKSFYRITLATIISCLISIPLALLIYSNKLLDDLITPLTNVIRYIPVTAFSPLLVLWVGIGENMKITFLFCATFFYFLPSMVLCVKEVDHRLIETGQTMGMNKFQVITKIVIPYTLPSMCESILMMYGIGWSYIVVAEATNATRGLGYLINIGSARGRTDMVFMSIITIMIISFIVDSLGKKIIHKVFAWKYKNVEE